MTNFFEQGYKANRTYSEGSYEVLRGELPNDGSLALHMLALVSGALNPSDVTTREELRNENRSNIGYFPRELDQE